MAISAGAASSPQTLKDAFKEHFLIGVAINQRQFTGQDTNGAAIVRGQFSSTTPENVMKWEVIHPRPGVDGYNFEPADAYVAFGEKNGMFIIGHTLVWHSQTPRWVFQGEGTNALTREVLLERMRDHIHTVVGRYKGRVKGWDVVNEALQDNGDMRRSAWYRIIGEDYIEKAFEYAHEADPNAELYYNDYSLENEAKRNGAVALIKRLKEKGVPVSGIGSQDHVKMDWPTTAQLDATLTAFGKLGVKVMITELDVDMLSARGQNRSADVAEVQRQVVQNVYTNGLPDSVQEALTKRYAELFAVYLKHRHVISRVTFWGVTDGDSWLNRGRQNHPLLFDRQWQPKPALNAIIDEAGKARSGPLP
jgi:endo-1,4-beta-xylanase